MDTSRLSEHAQLDTPSFQEYEYAHIQALSADVFGYTQALRKGQVSAENKIIFTALHSGPLTSQESSTWEAQTRQ